MNTRRLSGSVVIIVMVALSELLCVEEAAALTFPGAEKLTNKKVNEMKAADQIAHTRYYSQWSGVVSLLIDAKTRIPENDVAHLYINLELLEVYLYETRDIDKSTKILGLISKQLDHFNFDQRSVYVNFPRYSNSYKALYFDEYFSRYRNITLAQISKRVDKAQRELNRIVSSNSKDPKKVSDSVKQELTAAILEFESILKDGLEDLDTAKVLSRLALFNLRIGRNKKAVEWNYELEKFLGSSLAGSYESDSILSPLYQLELFTGLGDELKNQGLLDRAESKFETAIATYERYRSSISNQELRISIFSNIDALYSRLIEVRELLNDKWSLVSAIEKTKARTFIESLQGIEPVNYSRDRIAEADIQTKKLRGQNLQDGQGILSYYIADKFLVSVLITNKAVVKARQSIAKSDLEKLVASLFENVDDSVFFRSNSASLKRLSNQLISPLQEGLKSVSELVIVPHGFLHSLPFEALQLNQRYLIEDRSIVYAPSIGVYEKFLERKFSKAKYPVAIFGNPKYPIDVPNLEGAEIEAGEIAMLFEGAALHKGTKATETNFIRIAPSSAIVHLATHGKFISNNPMSSFFLLAQDEKQDGFIYASNLAEISLEQNKLFVLSACETSMEQVLSGDDLFGFTRSLSQSGVGSILSALWTISDDSTLLLMREFYQHVQAGSTFNKALQLAKIKLMQQYPDPYHWASFRLIGNGQLKY